MQPDRAVGAPLWRGGLTAALLVGCGTSQPADVRPPTVDLGRASATAEPLATAAPTASPTSDPSETAPSDLVVGGLPLRSPKMPATVVLDGKLDEWKFKGPTGLAVAVDARRVVIAVAWQAAPERGLYVALGEPTMPYPKIGWQQRGGSTHELTEESCKVQQVPMIEGGWMDGEKNPAELVEACRGVLSRHQAKATTYVQRFMRAFKITPAGVTPAGPGADAAWTAGAVVAASERGVEVELPLAALPELTHAPLTRLLVAAAPDALPVGLEPPVRRYNDGKPPVYEGWSQVRLEAPVGFGPRASLLAKAFELNEDESMYAWMSVHLDSYHPTNPEQVRSVSVDEVAGKPVGKTPKGDGIIGPPTTLDRPSTTEALQPIYTPWKTFKTVEIGLTNYSVIATYVGGELKGYQPFGKPMGSRELEDSLHLFEFSQGAWNPYMGNFSQPAWTAIAIGADGAIRADLAAASPDDGGWSAGWDKDPKPFVERDHLRFGVRGTRQGRPRAVVWVWDEKSGTYEATASPPLER